MNLVQRTCTIRKTDGTTFSRVYGGATIHDSAKNCAEMYTYLNNLQEWRGLVHVLDEDNNAHVVAVKVELKAEIDAENTVKI